MLMCKVFWARACTYGLSMFPLTLRYVLGVQRRINGEERESKKASGSA